MQHREWRVYLVPAEKFTEEAEQHFELTDDAFMSMAEQQGTVYSIKTFANYFNEERINSESFIRIIAVPCEEQFANASEPESYVFTKEELYSFTTKAMQRKAEYDAEGTGADGFTPQFQINTFLTEQGFTF